VIQVAPQMRIPVAIEPTDLRKGVDGLAQRRLSKGRLVWRPTGKEATRSLQAQQAQLPLAAGNPETTAAPVWREVS